MKYLSSLIYVCQLEPSYLVRVVSSGYLLRANALLQFTNLRGTSSSISSISLSITIMRAHNAIISAAAAYCCAVADGFQPSAINHICTRPSTIRLHSVSSSGEQHQDVIANNNVGPLGESTGGCTNESPRSLSPNRSFLGIRRESGVVRRMMEQQKLAENQNTQRNRKTALSQSATALMPDGGLSPCVIKVLGVGGGGSNAVRFVMLY